METRQGVLMGSSQSNVAGLAVMESVSEDVVLLCCCVVVLLAVICGCGTPTASESAPACMGSGPNRAAGAVWGAGVRDGTCGCFGGQGYEVRGNMYVVRLSRVWI